MTDQNAVENQAQATADSPGILEPPTAFGGIVRQLGPGLIIAASIVGSGELIATTKTGAQAGISLLWLIIVGCIIKVFVQIELGRAAIGLQETTLTSLNRVPGPRLRVNWILWYWLVMMLVGFGQLGGIVGGVGQSLAMAKPITGDYVSTVMMPSENELKHYIAWEDDIADGSTALNDVPEDARKRIEASQAVIRERLEKLDTVHEGRSEEIVSLVRTLIEAERGEVSAEEADGAKKAVKAMLSPHTVDDKYWSVGVAIITIILLVRGRYGLIQNVSTVLVVAFTFVTIGNVLSLQFNSPFSIGLEEILGGLIPSLPPEGIKPPGLPNWELKQPLATALATFGIIGVGATELIMYPYWCMEKGYARFVGPNTGEDSWKQRALGWIRVMKYDAFASMIIYTLATIAFFYMGVAVMHSRGLDPEGMRMVSTLMEQYVPVFGDYAKWLFLAGAIAVLYSTYLVANAAWTRVYTDAFKVFGLMSSTSVIAHRRSIRILAVVLPLISLALYCTGINPVKLVLLSGLMQAIMLPMLGFAALYFRYKHTSPGIQPSKVWDILLILSCVGLLIAGGWGFYSNL